MQRTEERRVSQTRQDGGMFVADIEVIWDVAWRESSRQYIGVETCGDRLVFREFVRMEMVVRQP